MSELGIIRSYLVSLGFSTDAASFSKAQDSLGQIAKSISSFSSSLQGIAIAGGAIAGIGALADVINQFTLGVANATIQNEMFARQMWLNFNSAVAFKSSLDALGVSIQDLYLSPQLMDAFIKFRQVAQEMEPPADYQSVMNNLFGITLQFRQLKLEMTMGIMNIGYDLAKDLSGPLGNFQDGLQKMNNWIVENAPKWEAKIADLIARIVTLFEKVYDAGKDFVNWWDNLGTKWQHVIEISAGLIIAILAIGKAIEITMGILAGLADANLPLLVISAAILAIILLVQDYITYSKGGQSALSGVWKAITPDIKALWDAFKGLGTALLDMINAIAQLIGGQGKLVNWGTVIADAFKAVLTVITAVVMGVSSIADGISIVAGEAEKLLGMHENNPQMIAQGEADIKTGEQGLYDTWIAPDQPGAPGSPVFGPPDPPGKASGGLASGPTLVGEKGPEILNLPGGSQIFSNSVLTNMLSAFKNLGAPRASNKTNTITLSPVYYISGAGSPQQTADAIQGNNLSLIMRVQQGIMG